MPEEERRSGIPSRRRDDLVEWRLDHAEHDITALVTRLDLIQTELSLPNLDNRYIKRDELRESKTRSQEWMWRGIGALFAIGQLALAYAALKGH